MFLPEGRSLAIDWHFRRRSGLTDKQMQALAREMNLCEAVCTRNKLESGKILCG
jgi:predicted PhzF superfamily epimerase YddE/YHI9